jgi:hypothetical protein
VSDIDRCQPKQLENTPPKQAPSAFPPLEGEKQAPKRSNHAYCNTNNHRPFHFIKRGPFSVKIEACFAFVFTRLRLSF